MLHAHCVLPTFSFHSLPLPASTMAILSVDCPGTVLKLVHGVSEHRVRIIKMRGNSVFSSLHRTYPGEWPRRRLTATLISHDGARQSAPSCALGSLLSLLSGTEAVHRCNGFAMHVHAAIAAGPSLYAYASARLLTWRFSPKLPPACESSGPSKGGHQP